MTGERDALLHADDADIVRWIDGALPNEERAVLEAHLKGCAECSTRQAAVVRRAGRMSELLRALDRSAPATPLRLTVAPHPASLPVRAGRLPGYWRVAAVLALALAGAAAVPPVRAWIVEVAKAVWARATGSTVRSERGPADPAAAQTGAVAFVPIGPVLTIRLPARRNATLTVEVVGGEQVSALGAAHRPPRLLVFPDELRIEDEEVAADYVVRVPVRLEAVRIVIGGGSAQIFRPSAPGERRTFSLTPADR